jgi:Ca2+:H+ antiporter
VKRAVLIAVTFGLTAIAGVLHYATDEPVATFVVCAIALAGLAWLVALGTEALGGHFGPAVTGVLQSTLGNLPELFVVLFALSAGETVVAQTSILGSLFANALLVLGLSIVAGARAADDSCMRFGKRLPNDTAVLTLLAVFLIVVLGVSDRVGDRASHHTLAISIVGAVVLLLIYASWLPGYLRDDTAASAPAEAGAAPHLPLPPALVLLAAAGVGAALVSDWFISALDPAVKSLGISKAFTGLVIVGIAGNAVENAVGITLAAKGKSDLALSVIKNSVSQIAVFLYPTLVLASLFFAHRLTFVVNPVLTVALALTAIAVWAITGDGKAAAFEGWALVGLYVILAALTWYE